MVYRAMTSAPTHSFRTDSAHVRLDGLLTELLPELSRSRAQSLIRSGAVRVNGRNAKPSQGVSPGSVVEIWIPETPQPTELEPEEIPLQILYEDEHVLAVDKAAGLVVHPAHGNWTGTLVQALLHHTQGKLGRGQFSIGGELRPGIVHRIDKETSGVLIVAKTDAAFQMLSDQFRTHSLTRRYQALVWGTAPDHGVWEGPIGRDPKDRKRMAVVPDGRASKTQFKTLEHFGVATQLELELFTGRTHQIRVHASQAGFPLVGDGVYGNATRAGRRTRETSLGKIHQFDSSVVEKIEKISRAGLRQMLHAYYLKIQIPKRTEPLVIESPLPEDFLAMQKLLRLFREKKKK